MEWGLFGGILLAWCAALCWFDVRERRLPNVLTLPAATVALLAAGWAAFDGAPSVLAGAAIWTGIYAVVFLLRGIGAGDVKVAPTLGAAVGCLCGVPGVLLAVLAAQLITVVWVVLARTRLVPHGPAMCLAALGVIAIFWL